MDTAVTCGVLPKNPSGGGGAVGEGGEQVEEESK